MNSKNKALRFIVGAFVIYLTYQLHAAGWFATAASLLFSSGYGGFGSGLTDLVLSALPLIVDAVCVVGAISIAFSQLVWGLVKPTAHRLLWLLDAKLEEYWYDLFHLDGEDD